MSARYAQVAGPNVESSVRVSSELTLRLIIGICHEFMLLGMTRLLRSLGSTGGGSWL